MKHEEYLRRLIRNDFDSVGDEIDYTGRLFKAIDVAKDFGYYDLAEEMTNDLEPCDRREYERKRA